MHAKVAQRMSIPSDGRWRKAVVDDDRVAVGDADGEDHRAQRQGTPVPTQRQRTTVPKQGSARRSRRTEGRDMFPR